MLAAAWLIPMRAAARLMLPVSSTATNVRRRFKSRSGGMAGYK